MRQRESGLNATTPVADWPQALCFLGWTLVLGIDEGLDSGRQFFFAERSDIDLDVAVVVDEGKGGLVENTQLLPNDTVSVDEMVEGADFGFFDKVDHRLNVVGSARKADEGDFLTE